MLYQLIFKLVFRQLDAEFAHHIGMFGIRTGHRLGLTKIGALGPKDTASVDAFGIRFAGQFGLAAGFDKNAVAIEALGDLGFSHVEIGTVTAISQPGNDKPRLFRLVADRALINRMGFNNQGADVVAERLRLLRAGAKKLPVIGVNIGKSKVVDVDQAADDYFQSALKLAPYADYLAVNVSSPNTPGLRSLQSVSSLRPILESVIQANRQSSADKPILVKIAPDLADEDIIAVADLARELGLAGIIATNTTISRSGLKTPAEKVAEMGAGGLSGAPLKQRSIEVLKLLNQHLAGSMAIISVGGIETAAEAKERLDAGATLVQGYTGFIYHGPLWARKINRRLNRI